MLIQSKVILKTPPRGDRGGRGNRGIVGKNAACSECGDDLCYKKMLYNITNTINFWKQENELSLVDDNYVIPNEYIKDKIQKHCGSKEFKEMLSKYGSNNNTTSDGDSSATKPSGLTEVQCPAGFTGGCGAYDYMFKIWSIWILIILRYKNGLFFLESEGLNENDFEGLIDDDDKDGAEAWNTMFNGDVSTDIKTLSSIKKTTADDGQVTYGFKNIGSDGGKTDGIQPAFITKIGNVPGGGANGPFEEIKKYRAWRWGSDNALKPKFTIENEPKNKICDSCWNSSMCTQNDTKNTNTGGLKFKFSNSYKQLVNTEIFNNSITTKYLKPFQPLQAVQVSKSQGEGVVNKVDFGLTDNDHITLFRPQVLIDDSEEPYFREYKPLGDVILKNSEYTNTQVGGKKCAPNDPNNKFYDEEIFKSVLGKKDGGKVGEVPYQGDANRSEYKEHDFAPHIYTLLVAGDTQPPIDYEIVGSTINKILSTPVTDSDDTPLESITVWKPNALEGYVACGYVIDKRPYNTSATPPKPPKPPKPPLDLIATIPKASLGEYPFNLFTIPVAVLGLDEAIAALATAQANWDNLSANWDNLSAANYDDTVVDVAGALDTAKTDHAAAVALDAHAAAPLDIIGSFSRSNLNLFKMSDSSDITTGVYVDGTGDSCTTSDGTNCYTCVKKPSTVGLDLSSGVEVLGTVKKNKKYSILKIYE